VTVSFVEEILLLLHDEATGRFVELPNAVFMIVVGGAALMDLELHNRVDTDLTHLTVVDRTPMSDDILDDLLGRIDKIAAAAGGSIEITEALFEAASHAQTYQPLALARLIARGILREDSGRYLWVFHSRRYPLIDDAEQQEVRARLRQLLLSDDIPEPRDIVLVCLVDACALLRFVLSPSEVDDAEPRVRQLRKMDFIGQAVVRSASETEAIIRFSATTL
jgi:golgi phosphoprotein 3